MAFLCRSAGGRPFLQVQVQQWVTGRHSRQITDASQCSAEVGVLLLQRRLGARWFIPWVGPPGMPDAHARTKGQEDVSSNELAAASSYVDLNEVCYWRGFGSMHGLKTSTPSEVSQLQSEIKKMHI